MLMTRLVPSPVGELTLVGSDHGLRAVLWSERAAPEVARESRGAVLEEAARQLQAYFAGDLREFDLPLDLVGTEFQVAAWRALADIPYGTTISYSEQARRLGRPRAVRAVGAANGRNPLPIVLPCHRIVGADGSLVGFGGGLSRKELLLAHEARYARAGISTGTGATSRSRSSKARSPSTTTQSSRRSTNMW
ncbi:MAG: methylated-DNA--[protein]-cysteine S-methyltransferase [Gaiellaceae bacterium]